MGSVKTSEPVGRGERPTGAGPALAVTCGSLTPCPALQRGTGQLIVMKQALGPVAADSEPVTF